MVHSDSLLREVVEKITPGVLEIASLKEPGQIVIHFGPGGVFKFATVLKSL